MENINKTKMRKALVEVSEILLKMNDEEYAKIPFDVLDYIECNKDKSYVWKYNDNLIFEEQKLSEYTLEVLAYLCMEYILEGDEQVVAKEWFKMNIG